MKEALPVQQAILTPDAPPPNGFYSQAVQAGPMLYVSGQLPVREGQVVAESAAEQTRFVLQSIRAILRAAGGDLGNVVQVTIYIADIALWSEVNAVYQEVLGAVPVPPARCIVPVKELHFGAKVEIQATAYLPGSAR